MLLLKLNRFYFFQIIISLYVLLYVDFTENPPVLKPPARNSHCPADFEGWRDLGGEYCYYFETEKAQNFYKAQFNCNRMGKYIWQIFMLHIYITQYMSIIDRTLFSFLHFIECFDIFLSSVGCSGRDFSSSGRKIVEFQRGIVLLTSENVKFHCTEGYIPPSHLLNATLFLSESTGISWL